MTRTDAQRRAQEAYLAKLAESGVKLVSNRFRAATREGVERYAKTNKLSLNAAYEALIEAGLGVAKIGKHRAEAKRLIAEMAAPVDPVSVLGDPKSAKATDKLQLGPAPFTPKPKKGK